MRRRPLGSRSIPIAAIRGRSEEHTSELQSQSNLVCRLLLEKKKKTDTDAAEARPGARDAVGPTDGRRIPSAPMPPGLDGAPLPASNGLHANTAQFERSRATA